MTADKGKHGLKIKWDVKDIDGISTVFKWNTAPNNPYLPPYTWDEVELVSRAAGDLINEPWQQWKDDDKEKLVKLICKVNGKTYKKTKKIQDIKISAEDIRLLAEKVLGVGVITENIKF